MTTPWRTRVSARLRWWHSRIAAELGLAGTCAIALLLCAWGAHYHLLPRMNADAAAQRHIMRGLQAEIDQKSTQPRRPSQADHLNHLYNGLPVVSDAAQVDALTRLHDVAQSGQLTLEQGAYRQESSDGESVIRFDIVVNAKGNYHQTRSFALRSLQNDPALALMSVRLVRSSVGDPAIDGEFRFSLFMRVP